MTSTVAASVRLKRLVSILDARRIPLNNEERSLRPGEIPYWGSGGVVGHVDVALFDEELVLLGEDGAPFFDLNRPVAFHVTGPVWINNHVHVLRPSREISGEFLTYFLNQVEYSLYITGSTRDKLTQEDMREIAVSLPPLDEQRQIAEYLDRETGKIDTLVEKQERLIETLAERKAAVVARAFSVIDATKTVPLKYVFSQSRASNEPEMTVLSVYRDYGVVPKSSRADNFNKTPEDLTRYLVVRPGDLVVNKMKAWQGSLGVSEHAGIVSPDYEVARPVSNALDTRFVHYLLRNQRYVAEYSVRSVGIRPSQWRLYWDQLGQIGIPVPPLHAQKEIVRLVEREEAQIDALSAKSGEMTHVLRERRQALISAAVTGKIDVRGL